MDLPYILNAKRPAQRRNINGVSGVALQGFPCRRMILVPGHAGSGIIQDQHGPGGIVVYHIHQRIDAGM